MYGPASFVGNLDILDQHILAANKLDHARTCRRPGPANSTAGNSASAGNGYVMRIYGIDKGRVALLLCTCKTGVYDRVISAFGAAACECGTFFNTKRGVAFDKYGAAQIVATGYSTGPSAGLGALVQRFLYCSGIQCFTVTSGAEFLN